MIFFVVFMLLALQQNALSITNCPSEWTSSNFPNTTNKCYKLFTSFMSYIDAQSYCQTQGTGGNLVSVHSRFELNLIANVMVDTPVSPDNWFWIGLDNLRSSNENIYSWIDGTPLDFTNWFPGEPSNVDRQPCVGMWGPLGNDRNMKWFTPGDGACEGQHWFMCQLTSSANPSL